MTDKEIIDRTQNLIDYLDNKIVDLPTCSIRDQLVTERSIIYEFFQLLKTDGVVRESFKKFNEECDRYQEAGYNESMQVRFAFEACIDLGTTKHVADKLNMIGGVDDEHLSQGSI